MLSSPRSGDALLDDRQIGQGELQIELLYIAPRVDSAVGVRHGIVLAESTWLELADLPGGPINHHWTKSLIASADGQRLYAGVGSNSNVAEKGMDKEVNRAAILEIDPAAGRGRVFASGLRNPVGMDWHPTTGVLWTVVNERDELGSDLVPDYMTSVREGGFYGWPYSYYGAHVDERVTPQRPDLVKIEASDVHMLEAARPALIQVTATLRSYAGYDLAYPALDLVLTNANEHALARRIFVPEEYLDATRDPAAGFPPRGPAAGADLAGAR